MLFKGVIFRGILFQKFVEIDTISYTYRFIHGFLHLFRFKEKTRTLPSADYLLIFRTLYVKCESCTAEEFEKYGVWQLSLVYNKKRKFVLEVSDNKEKIFSDAKMLALEWNLRILDNGSRRGKPVWLK